METYDRYSKFRAEGEIEIVPYVKIPVKDTDIYIEYIKNETRLDNISYKYYENSNYGWLIMQANPEYGSMEFNIPNNSRLRIPYPLADTLSDYNSAIDNYKNLYGDK